MARKKTSPVTASTSGKNTTEGAISEEEMAHALLPSDSLFGTVLKPLASLKLTVFLFAISIFLVLAGTLAQTHMNLAQVLSQYFRCWFAWMEFKAFFPPTWIPEESLPFQGNPVGFWFPGGWLIGIVMTVNLLSAHIIRIKSHSKGNGRVIGIILMIIGLLLMYAIVQSGSHANGVVGSWKIGIWNFSWDQLWLSIKAAVLALAGMSIFHAVAKKDIPKPQFHFFMSLGVFMGILGTALILKGEKWQVDDSGMRILWQLIQGTVASLVLLAGCHFLFQKRAGIVLLHAGVLLIMSNELLVATSHVESRMSLTEGEAKNYTFSLEKMELAIIDHSDPKQIREVVVPLSRFQKITAPKNHIRNEKLPFNINTLQYYENSHLRALKKGESSIATHGKAVDFAVIPAPPITGVAMGEMNRPAVVFEVFSKNSSATNEANADSKSLGIYACPLRFSDTIAESEIINTNGKNYQVLLRFKRFYKPYTIKLNDVRKDDYMGTTIPRNYSSSIHLVNPKQNEDREYNIKMNDPLRHAGETFYQSGYDVDPQTGKEMTQLQVVSNVGWMIPYVGCMVVATGMLSQFLAVLFRFLAREERRNRLVEKQTKDSVLSHAIVGMAVCFFGWSLLRQAAPPEIEKGEFNLHAFGKIPVVYQGRVKPLDTLARNTMRILANRETYYTPGSDEKKYSEITPAIHWLANLITDNQESNKDRVIKIDLALAEELGLEKRKKHLYSINDLMPHIPKIQTDAKNAVLRKKEGKRLTKMQTLNIDLAEKLVRISNLTMAFQEPTVHFSKDIQQIKDNIRRARQYVNYVQENAPPLLVPPSSEPSSEENNSPKKWQALSVAIHQEFENKFLSIQTQKTFKPDPYLADMQDALSHYATKDVEKFNGSVVDLLARLKNNPPEKYDAKKIDIESHFNNFAPLFYTAFFYIIPLVLTLAGWLFQNRTCNRVAFWLMIFLFAVHAYALGLRIYISGRPPVTNLYSSAVFIGWAGVLAAIVIEKFFSRGIGNAIGAILGYSTLLIAHNLAGDGETIVVLQAVLDTQFWLATHVVCISLGYTATFLAGLIGIMYIMGEIFAPRADRELGKTLTRMIYGTICFAMFFSFFGTVLGGLWADDSWGRFWGWDPKENGALLIVLWNALVLHARWDKLVGDRGFAALAIGGNIITAWSWFGVNELGVGLHSYGFTDGVLFYLSMFWLSQLALIGLAMIPRGRLFSWASRQTPPDA